MADAVPRLGRGGANSAAFPPSAQPSCSVRTLSARGLVPDRIIDKPKIGFFNAAVSAWTQRALDDLVPDRLLNGVPAISSFVDQKTIRELLTKYPLDNLTTVALGPLEKLE